MLVPGDNGKGANLASSWLCLVVRTWPQVVHEAGPLPAQRSTQSLRRKNISVDEQSDLPAMGVQTGSSRGGQLVTSWKMKKGFFFFHPVHL